jgi:hypothetical protein
MNTDLLTESIVDARDDLHAIQAPTREMQVQQPISVPQRNSQVLVNGIEEEKQFVKHIKSTIHLISSPVSTPISSTNHQDPPPRQQKEIYNENISDLIKNVDLRIEKMKAHTSKTLTRLNVDPSNAGKWHRARARSPIWKSFLKSYTSHVIKSCQDGYSEPEVLDKKPYPKERSKLDHWMSKADEHLHLFKQEDSNHFDTISKMTAECIYFEYYIPITDDQQRKAKGATLLNHLATHLSFKDNEDFAEFVIRHETSGEDFMERMIWTSQPSPERENSK